MSTAILNVGLHRKNKPALSAQDVISTLRALQVTILDGRVADSTTEPTFVCRIAKPVTAFIGSRIAELLGQDCIAQYVRETGQGELFGPYAAKWRPFNLDFFLSI